MKSIHLSTHTINYFLYLLLDLKIIRVRSPTFCYVFVIEDIKPTLFNLQLITLIQRQGNRFAIQTRTKVGFSMSLPITPSLRTLAAPKETICSFCTLSYKRKMYDLFQTLRIHEWLCLKAQET